MIFTESRTSFLIVVAFGFICYLYCSFCIYVHQIFTCFELLQSQKKKKEKEWKFHWHEHQPKHYLYQLQLQLPIQSHKFCQHSWNDIKIWLIQIGFSLLLWWVLLGFVFCIMHNWLLYIWLESVICYCYDEYLCIVLSNNHLNNIYKQ